MDITDEEYRTEEKEEWEILKELWPVPEEDTLREFDEYLDMLDLRL